MTTCFYHTIWQDPNFAYWTEKHKGNPTRTRLNCTHNILAIYWALNKFSDVMVVASLAANKVILFRIPTETIFIFHSIFIFAYKQFCRCYRQVSVADWLRSSIGNNCGGHSEVDTAKCIYEFSTHSHNTFKVPTSGGGFLQSSILSI